MPRIRINGGDVPKGSIMLFVKYQHGSRIGDLMMNFLKQFRKGDALLYAKYFQPIIKR